jgi:hypothetical protein
MTTPVREMIERAGRQVPIDQQLQFQTVAEAVDWFAGDHDGAGSALQPASAIARRGTDAALAADDPGM